ncbi:hypothetical protein [Rhizobium sp. GN54]|uniref:hypothetical protein n=1 Tax=Rhizobium sp. GN54 TaxID=2898150 RepID=UPI001E3FBE05|nr:hypothetical protein [Rhizobium sp. GN54]MCD2183307.1 hypothetical protein [Rhizobium sp. GN54]
MTKQTTIKANGPASVGALPDRGSINPQKDMKMNEARNTTPAGQPATLDHPVKNEHPWETVRRLTKALSTALGTCNDGRWFAQVMPPEPMVVSGAAAYPMDPDEAPVDRVNRLAWELAEALNDYQGGRFQARIYPSDQAGYAVMLSQTAAYEREVRS